MTLDGLWLQWLMAATAVATVLGGMSVLVLVPVVIVGQTLARLYNAMQIRQHGSGGHVEHRVSKGPHRLLMHLLHCLHFFTAHAQLRTHCG